MRRIGILGAASSIGIRPYDDRSEPRHLDRAPAVLRQLGLCERLDAEDFGDVRAPEYRDFVRPIGGVRNEELLVTYSESLAQRVAATLEAGRFVLVLGGDCSIVLGSLLGATRSVGRVGLAYIDGHADFATARESATGSAASMCLAHAVGRDDSPLARLRGASPLVNEEDVALVGRRDEGEPYGHAALAESRILDVTGGALVDRGGPAVAAVVLERLSRDELDGFWIHVDADVLDAAIMPAVDSPEPDGPGIEELATLVRPLAGHPKALGMQLTIYDPGLDADGVCATRLVSLLERIFGRATRAGSSE